ncbi:alpha/beta fold hydrolase [Allostreptomyces psammosilenae]|uniref:Pimeloyl-ACP methyl ester carboxylesterase n=1 Tax=Allostreptomyces psammosilenae TaxID=1892865 RepID=A0A853A0K6_9ACTN|nr:alpha/beta hydrolase [Allostreptomyces psammosilenae]NYI03928.1 pimeloyl-ACP methyl ester carboxylesterase [Allostreptomyces psammosilenae]
MPTLKVDDAVIAYTDTGPPSGRPDAPTVVFGHGLLFSGWMFHPQIAALRRRYRCVALDWRGQGATPATASGYDMDTLTDDATALIRALGGAPVHYVGLSMGGFVGQRLAARHGGLLRSLTLLNTSADAEDPSRLGRYRLLASAYRVGGIMLVRRQVLPLMFGPAFLGSRGSRPVIDEWTRRLRRPGRAGVRRAVLGVTDRAPVRAELGNIHLPTLVVAGADDRALPPAEAERIAAGVAGARLETLPATGHSSTLERPDAVTDLLRDFLATVDRG